MSNSLTKESYYQNLETYPADKTVKILNPLSSDLNSMRQTLLFNGLEAIERNIRYKNFDQKLYEFGNCYFFNNDKTKLKERFFEKQHLAVYITGLKNEVNWKTTEQKSDFFYLKSYAENILKKLNFCISDFTVEEFSNDIYSYALKYSLNNQQFLTIGAVKSSLLKKMDIEQDVFYADLEWEMILQKLPAVKKFKQLANFPEVRRDLALLIDENITFKQIKELAFKTERNYLKNVSIFDVYKNEKLGEGKKSYAVSFVFQDENKTFTDNQIEKIMQRMVDVYKKEIDAVIR
jgi:phenylalanyl-tRNA synthetase beta chain